MKKPASALRVDFSQIGKAAMMPGVRYFADWMIECLPKKLEAMMEEMVEEWRASIAGEAAKPKAKRGRPPAAVVSEELPTVREALGGKPPRRSNWPADPEERKREMARRMAVARGEKPSVKLAPDYSKTIKKMSNAQKASWAKLTPRQRKARARAAQAGRLAAQAAKQQRVNGAVTVQ